ncbi:MAG: NYN domain-containing protein [Rikenellaceae bacterium]
MGPLKVAVFYDGNFLLHTSNYYNYSHAKRSRLSINGLHNFVRHRIAKEENLSLDQVLISEAHYFRGRLNAMDASQRGNQLYNDRVFDDVLMSEGINTHYLPLRNVSGRREERGTDVWLSLEAYSLAMEGKMDIAVLILSDTDYVPLLRKLNAAGVKVMLLGWEFDYTNEDGSKVVTRTSVELIQLAQYPLAMHNEIEEGLANEDPVIERVFIGGANLERVPSININVEGLGSGDSDYSDGEVETSEIFSLKNNFGFIRYPNNNLFFHALDLDGDFEDLQEGDTVEFTIGKNQLQQDVAKNVKKIQ